MARYEGGWIKVHRKMFEGDIAQNIHCLGVWIGFLSMATWKETKIIWQGKQRTLPPGSVVFGFSELARKWDCSPNTVKRWAKYLHDTERVLLEVCTAGCLATICNWESYQANENEGCTQAANELQTNCKPTANELQLNEEVQEGKKGRRKRIVNPAESHPLVEIWNQHRGKLPKCMGLNAERKTKAEALWSAIPKTEYWGEVVIRMSRSSFCRGEKSTGEHSNWKADFDFLIREGTHLKVLEGKYDDKETPIVRTSTEASQAAHAKLFGTQEAS